jgi:lysine 6-dehydrogenase
MGDRYVVVGGAGAMGQITVKDLVTTAPLEDEILIADYDLAKAEQLAAALQSPRVRAVQVNIRDIATTAVALQGAVVVINTAPYAFNLEVMAAALEAQTHYIDLGGLFHTTRQQLKLDRRFQAIARTALLGMGAAPGISNILARLGADRLDQVTEIHLRVAGIDRTLYDSRPALSLSYSLKTILEEFSLEPAIFTEGEFRFLPPMSGAKPLKFPQPVGVQSPLYTLHSEVATLPLSFAEQGVTEVSFKIAFEPEFVEKVRFLRDLGFASHAPIPLAGGEITPIDVANYLALHQPTPQPLGKLKQYEVIRAIVKGFKAGKKVTQILDCHTPGMPEWGIGMDIDTGAPPAIAAQLLARGEITLTGTVPPELAVPPTLFFAELQRRGMKIKTRQKKGWEFPI